MAPFYWVSQDTIYSIILDATGIVVAVHSLQVVNENTMQFPCSCYRRKSILS